MNVWQQRTHEVVMPHATIHPITDVLIHQVEMDAKLAIGSTYLPAAGVRETFGNELAAMEREIGRLRKIAGEPHPLANYVGVGEPPDWLSRCRAATSHA
jgi:hypothetical protein